MGIGRRLLFAGLVFATGAVHGATAVLADPGVGPARAVADAPTVVAAIAAVPDPSKPTDDHAVGEKPAPIRYETLTVVLGGDLGFNGSLQPLVPNKAMRHGRSYYPRELTEGIVPLIKGDIVFANLETVVTDRSNLAPLDKRFVFRSHPGSIRHLVEIGFNVFGAANNHAIDYGSAGIAETLRHLEGMKDAGLLAAPGIGLGREAATAPADVRLRTARVRISASGIGGATAAAGSTTPTMASYQPSVFQEVGERLRDAEGDLRILSVHFGQELQVRPSASDERRLRSAALDYNIDIIAGHHAHVAAGVQDVEGRIIFYGLGNLLHPGMQDMGRFNACRDFGLMARVHLWRVPGKRFEVRAIEVMALRDMHLAPRLRAGEEGRRRIDVLNAHAAGLDDRASGARGVRFVSMPDGTGLYCAADAQSQNDEIGRRCSDIGRQIIAVAERPISRACGADASVMAAGGGETVRGRHVASGASLVQPSNKGRTVAKPARRQAAGDGRFFPLDGRLNP